MIIYRLLYRKAGGVGISPTVVGILTNGRPQEKIKKSLPCIRAAVSYPIRAKVKADIYCEVHNNTR